MMILSIISINVPGLVQIVQQILLNFIYMDLLQTDKWVTPIFYTEEQLAEDEPLNMFFDLNGLGSPRFIVTTGSSFVFLVIFVFEHLLYIFARDFISRFTPLGPRLADKLSQKLHWAGTVRFIMQQFAPLLLASVMNLFKFEFSSVGDFINIQCSAVIIVSSPYIVLKFASVLHNAKAKGMLEDEAFTSQYEDLIDGLNLTTTVGLYWNIIIFVRWIITIAIIILFRDVNSVQITLLMTLSIFFMALLQLGRPFPSPPDVTLATLNELLISAYLYLLMCLTDYNELGAFRLFIGLALLFTVVFCVVVNVLYVFGGLVGIGARRVYLKWLRCRARQARGKKYVETPAGKEQVKLETIEEEVEDWKEQTQKMVGQQVRRGNNESSNSLLNDINTMRQTNANSSLNNEEQDILQDQPIDLYKRQFQLNESPIPLLRLNLDAEQTQTLDFKMLVGPSSFSRKRIVDYSQKARDMNRKPFR
ncbi:hypothetical protein FGO68_gene10292 [Halteria grandinella]|uniref:TRP C-terminal domain-containing protein n=1 Tax=Halteria grandinella TaxID=5974 RepID=A0A8J8P4E5_HALGN|nr:hypothetical protein FGO68_gene10292 [Halteria grandinella]